MPALPFLTAADGLADEADPDYLYFLRHLRADGDSYALQLPAYGASPPPLVKYDPSPISNPDGQCASDLSQGRAGSDLRMEENDSPVAVDAGPALIEHLDNIDEDYRLFLQHARVMNGRLMLEIGGAVVNYDPDAASSGGSREIEEESAGQKEKLIASSGKRVDAGQERKGIESDEPVVIASQSTTWDWLEDPTPIRKVDDEGLLHRPALHTPGTSKSKRDTRRGNCDDAGSHAVPRPQGVIWPAHINQRPDSDFKRRLMDVLLKPFSRREYIKLFDMASIRTPLVKLRQVRNDVKFYPTDDMGNSYFDHYPDLVGQVTNTTFSNGLALMRGFFFWLQNAAHEDQFRPWVDDSKDHDVIPLMD